VLMGWDGLALAMQYYRYSYGMPFLAIAFGMGLAINCIRGLASREGMFDESNTAYMTYMQWGGIVLGLGLAGWGVMFLVDLVQWWQ
jgi:hypothetical protein